MLNIQIFFSRKIKTLIGLLLILSLTACDGLFSSDDWSSDDDECDTDTTTVVFKQVGYWMDVNSDDSDETSVNTVTVDGEDVLDIDYSKLTHIIYGYLSVDDDGNLGSLSYNENFEDILENGQNAGIKVLISIGGEDSAENFESIAGDDEKIDNFINNINDLFTTYDELDGVDLSWQTPKDDDEGELFTTLIEEVSTGLDSGKLLTIELVSGLDDEKDYADVIDSDVFDYIDFANVRAFNTNDYDDLYLSEDDLLDVITYWTDRCMIQNKLVVGIPVYATGDDDTEYSYSEVIEEKGTAYACGDVIDSSDDYDTFSISSSKYYYNAIPLVNNKVNSASNYAGGVMMMSLDQDYFDSGSTDYSLLNAIYNEVEGNDSVCD